MFSTVSMWFKKMFQRFLISNYQIVYQVKHSDDLTDICTSKYLQMREVFVIDVVRTPVGKYGGTLSSIRPDDLLAHVIKFLLERNPTIDVNIIEDVIAGAANQSGEDNRNVARMSALLAG